jgi:hypothetical protein
MTDAPRDDPRTTPAAVIRPPGAWWRLPLLLALVLIAIIAARSSQTRTRGPASPTAAQPQPSADATGKTVSLAIRVDDGAEREFEPVAWRPGMTVDDLLMAVSQRPDSISYAVVGQGEMMLVTQIDDAANDQASGRFWTYSVNGQHADRSPGIFPLRPGDRVLWRFGSEQ